MDSVACSERTETSHTTCVPRASHDCSHTTAFPRVSYPWFSYHAAMREHCNCSHTTGHGEHFTGRICPRTSCQGHQRRACVCVCASRGGRTAADCLLGRFSQRGTLVGSGVVGPGIAPPEWLSHCKGIELGHRCALRGSHNCCPTVSSLLSRLLGHCTPESHGTRAVAAHGRDVSCRFQRGQVVRPGPICATRQLGRCCCVRHSTLGGCVCGSMA